MEQKGEVCVAQCFGTKKRPVVYLDNKKESTCGSCLRFEAFEAGGYHSTSPGMYVAQNQGLEIGQLCIAGIPAIILTHNYLRLCFSILRPMSIPWNLTFQARTWESDHQAPDQLEAGGRDDLDLDKATDKIQV